MEVSLPIDQFHQSRLSDGAVAAQDIISIAGQSDRRQSSNYGHHKKQLNQRITRLAPDSNLNLFRQDRLPLT